MTVSELLTAIRLPYIAALSAVSAQRDTHVEPAFRRADGSLATTGPFALPARADFIPRTGDGHPIRVDARTRMSFEPLSFQLGSTAVSIHPFAWDAVTVEASAAAPDLSKVLAAWFMAWFDADDDNPLNAEGLYGVVHFISDPVRKDLRWTVRIDLGSAPEQALEDLLFRLSRAGARQISVR